MITLIVTSFAYCIKHLINIYLYSVLFIIVNTWIGLDFGLSRIYVQLLDKLFKVRKSDKSKIDRRRENPKVEKKIFCFRTTENLLELFPPHPHDHHHVIHDKTMASILLLDQNEEEKNSGVVILSF